MSNTPISVSCPRSSQAALYDAPFIFSITLLHTWSSLVYLSILLAVFTGKLQQALWRQLFCHIYTVSSAQHKVRLDAHKAYICLISGLWSFLEWGNTDPYFFFLNSMSCMRLSIRVGLFSNVWFHFLPWGKILHNLLTSFPKQPGWAFGWGRVTHRPRAPRCNFRPLRIHVLIHSR